MTTRIELSLLIALLLPLVLTLDQFGTSSAIQMDQSQLLMEV